MQIGTYRGVECDEAFDISPAPSKFATYIYCDECREVHIFLLEGHIEIEN
jgi:hypothetical protein